MSILSDVLRELWKMFLGDMCLSLGCLAVVGLVWTVHATGLLGDLPAGLMLPLALIGVLADAVLRPARRKARSDGAADVAEPRR
ncbi:hypothetical protein [uncultured Jannaschia sp.]|uniref:hypothetical protein n=1 Tax=uncultured Jannaschia sp. TaxID=293347 RepID=UPI0026325F5C|nr:hypothetical protein [uncultured Jannaschia sp.]